MKSFKLVSLIFLSFLIKSSSAQVSYSTLHDNATFVRLATDMTGKPVGTISGSAGTSPGGAATYSIPISCPPGTAGMVPSISLGYNSQSGSGVLGQGWSVSGLSTITRTGKDYYHDGKVSPVNYTDNDVFLLDGSRLAVATGTNGADGSTYRTETESYATITSTGRISGCPEKFKVVSKEGTIMEYGFTTDSRIQLNTDSRVMMWRVNKIQDINGNYIEFVYDNTNRDSRISEIRYTGNTVAGVSPYNVVKFYYDIRADQNILYDGGSTMASKYLLTQIQILAEGDLFKTYQFTFGTNSNSVSYLKNIEEFVADGTKLNDTRFKYGDEATSVTETLNYDLIMPGLSTDIAVTDFDGDGLTDFLVSHVSKDPTTDNLYNLDLEIKKRTTTSSSYATVSTLPFTGIGYHVENFGTKRFTETKSTTSQYADFNGDGRQDVLVSNLSTDPDFKLINNISIYYANADGSMPSAPSYSYLPLSHWDAPVELLQGPDHRINYLEIGDFDGDGSSDFITMIGGYIYFNSPRRVISNKRISQIKVDGSIFTSPSDMLTKFDQYFKNAKYINVVSMDGDSKNELMVVQGDYTRIFTFDEVGSDIQLNQIGTTMGFPTEYHDISYGDFNGDGKTDIIAGPIREIRDDSRWDLGFYDGDHFVMQDFYFDHIVRNQKQGPTSTDRILIGDYDGDGKSDILNVYAPSGGSDVFNMYYSKGTAFALKKLPHTYNLEIGYSIGIGDFNGDGKSDLYAMKGDSYSSSDAVFIYFNANSKSHLMEKVTDGFNRTTEFTYEPLTKGTGSGATDFYTKGTGETYPVINVQYPVYVTTSMKAPDGIGGTTATTYKYENMRFHTAGRGLLGFEKVKATNTILNSRTEELYDLNRDFYVPYLKTSKSYLNSTGAQLTQVDNTINFARIGTGYCFKQTSPNTVSKDFLMGSTATTVNTYDGNGNVTKTVATTTAGAETFVESSVFTYIATGGLPIPNRMDYSFASKKRGSSPEMGIISNYEYDSKGRMNYVKKSPNIVSAATLTVHKFEYDDFGNIKHKSEESALGHIPASLWPSTSYVYDDKGRFMIKDVNTMGDFSTYSTDKFWGKILSSTGTNGLTTTNTYNNWGKLISVTIPGVGGGSYTVNYSDGWDISGNQLYYNLVSDPSAPDVKSWYDNMGRAVKVQKEGFSAWTTSLTTYNAKGGVVTGTNEYYTTETPLVTTNTYDDYNRISSVVNFTGTTSYTYTYLGDGFLTTTINAPDSKVSKTVSDFTGKIRKSMTNDVSKVVHFYYDSYGNEIKTRAGGFSTETHDLIKKEYDGMGRVLKMIDPDAGTITYEYDAFDNLKKQTDATGVVSTFTYDKLKRLISKDVAGDITTYEYYDKLQDYRLKKTKVVFGPGVYNVEDNYEYILGGGVTRHTRIALGNLFERSYTYDIYGRLYISDYLNSGFKKRNIYNSNGYLQKITTYMGGGVGEKTLYECNGVNGNGQVTNFKRVDGLAATTTYTNGIAVQFSTPGKQELKMGYNFANGNLDFRADYITNTTEGFVYDGADRLVRSSASKLASGGFVIGYPPLTMTYDPGMGSLGQLASKSDVGTYKYSGFPRNAVKSVSDPVGLISHQTQDILYRPFQKTGVIAENIGGVNYLQSFEYDAEEDRAYSTQIRGTTGGVSGTGGTTVYKRWYFGDFEANEDLTTSTTRMIHYIKGNAGVCGIVIAEGGIFKYYAVYTDHLGSIVTVTDETANTVAMQSYDAWGRERQPDTWDYEPSFSFGGIVVPPKPDWLYRGFTGHEMMPEYGLINMNGRMYDPLNGRMLCPDDYVQEPMNSQSYNRFSYCWNNPLKYTDPSGDLLWFVPLVYAAMNVGVDMMLHNGKMDFGQIASSAAMGAIGGAIGGGNIQSLAGAIVTAGANQFNRLIPSIPLLQTGNFNLSLSPMIGYGSSGFNLGGSLNASGLIGDFAYSVSASVGFNSGMSSLGDPAGPSNYFGGGVFGGYFDGHANFGIGFSSTVFDGASGQRTGAITVQIGDFGVRLDEDWMPHLGDKDDRFRTGGLLVTYRVNNDLTLAFGGSMMTGDANGNDYYDPKGNPTSEGGRGMHDNCGEDLYNLRGGTMYGGAIYKGQAYFAGNNSEKRLHAIQNAIHKSRILNVKTAYFEDREFKSRGYGYYGGYHPNYLYY